VLLEKLHLTPEELTASIGWELTPEGACQKDICVPLRRNVRRPDGTIDVETFAAEMSMPLVSDSKYPLWALGPWAGGRVIEDDQVPDVVLDTFDGDRYDLASLRGRKTLLLAWASW
jgi:hypothetical protein